MNYREQAHAALDRLLDKIDEAQRANSPEAVAQAEDRVRAMVWDLFKLLDETGATSRSYERAALGASPGELPAAREVDKRVAALNAAGRVLADAADALAPELRSFLSAVIVDMCDLLDGRSRPKDAPLSPVRARNRPRRSILVEQAGEARLVKAIYYLAGRDGITLAKALSLYTHYDGAHGMDAFKQRSRRVPLDERKFAQKTGRDVRAGRHLTPRQEQLRQEIEGLDLGKLKSLVLRRGAATTGSWSVGGD